jgi:hypothetical protein
LHAMVLPPFPPDVKPPGLSQLPAGKLFAMVAPVGVDVRDPAR